MRDGGNLIWRQDAEFDVAEGNFTEATRCLQDAWKQNPLASTVNALLCWTQYLSGDCDSAMSTAAQARASGECMTLNAAVEAFAAIQAGPIDSILPRLERVAGDEPRSLLLQGALGYAQATANQAGKAWETFYNLKRSQGDCSYPLALILIGLDEQEQAILCLETSFAEGSLWSLGFRFDPFLRPLHERDRYEPLLRKLRFPS